VERLESRNLWGSLCASVIRTMSKLETKRPGTGLRIVGREIGRVLANEGVSIRLTARVRPAVLYFRRLDR